MKVTLKHITVRELFDGYSGDLGEHGVVGYGGKLDIRPPYQREFIYKHAQQVAVIETLMKTFPLNVMYWAAREDGGYEIIDGQQRTMSICEYVSGNLVANDMSFDSYQADIQDKILDYELTVYICSGTDSEKLDWFKTINIAGESLSAQELLNAIYHGSWVSDAKPYFSKNDCAAHLIGGDYIKAIANRQEYLEKTLHWISGGNIASYMAKHKKDKNANELKKYYADMIDWIASTFTVKRKSMIGVDWGKLYNQYKDQPQDAVAIEKEVAKLNDDDEVTSHKGIYPYILTRDEKHLSLRIFDKHIIRRVTKKQGGKCAYCEKATDNLQGDHIKPWSKGGKTIKENCQMLCIKCNIIKSNK